MRVIITENESDNITFKREPVILVVLGLILLNLFGVAIYFCYFLIPIFILILSKQNDLIDSNFIFIFLFSFLYSVILFFYDVTVSGTQFIGYFIFPAILYFLGKYLVTKYPTITTIYFLLFFICFLFSILPFLANIRSAIANGFMQDRNLRMFWMEKDQVRSATGIGSYFAINMALLPLLLIQKESYIEKRLTLLSVFLFGMGVFSIFNMSNRTGLIVTIISIFFLIFIPKKNSLRTFLFVSLFLIMLVILYMIDAWNFRSWLVSSTYYERLSNTGIYEENSRFLIWKSGLMNLLKNPYGDINPLNATKYSHNFWLDVGRVTGIVPLIPLLIFTISSIASIYKVVFYSQEKTFLRVLIGLCGIAFFTTFFVEPVMEGLFIMFLIFCFYFGIVVGIRKFMQL